MLKKFVLILMCITVCLLGITPVLAQTIYSTLTEYEAATGNKIEKFNEAPMLRTKVAAGELPPVEERLPEDPMVIEPLEEIGQYGGKLKAPIMGRTEWSSHTARIPNLFGIPSDLKLEHIIPDIAKDWDWSEDLKTLTVYLRKGLKWSDGAPFTADDMMFWYEDILSNDELTPVKPSIWSPGGELVKVNKMDDYTVSFKFAVPWPTITASLSRKVVEPFAPKRYLKKYHIKYNSKANEIAKEEKFDHWWQCFGFHVATGNSQIDVNCPSLETWVLKEIDTSQNRYYERNPYYWKIDTAGNQLPYIDEQNVIQCENVEVINLKAIAGEFSYSVEHLKLENYPIYKNNEESGNYQVMLWPGPRASETAYLFNYTHKDPILKKIFNDIRWRQALSLAINREEVNDILFFGDATPMQPISLPEVSFFEPGMAKRYIDYDPERANKILDEMGLTWDENNQYRLRPDGKLLAITIEYSPGEGPKGRIHQLVKDYWEKVGVKVAVKEEERSFYRQRMKTGECDLGTWHYDQLSEFGMYSKPYTFLVPFRFGVQAWHDWHTNEATGEEPPEYIKRLFRLVDEWQGTLPGTDEYMRLGKEFLTLLDENLIAIGTVGMASTPIIVKNELKNFPKKARLDGGTGFFRPYHAEQWFFKK